jgi:hypothetical protein
VSPLLGGEILNVIDLGLRSVVVGPINHSSACALLTVIEAVADLQHVKLFVGPLLDSLHHL